MEMIIYLKKKFSDEEVGVLDQFNPPPSIYLKWSSHPDIENSGVLKIVVESFVL